MPPKFNAGDMVELAMNVAGGVIEATGVVVTPSSNLIPQPRNPFDYYSGHIWIYFDESQWRDRGLHRWLSSSYRPYAAVIPRQLPPPGPKPAAEAIHDDPAGVYCSSCGVQMEFANLAWKCPKCWKVL